MVKRVWETWTRTLPVLKGMMVEDSKYSLNLWRQWIPPYLAHLVTLSGCTATLWHLRDKSMLPTALKQLVPRPRQSVQTSHDKSEFNAKAHGINHCLLWWCDKFSRWGKVSTVYSWLLNKGLNCICWFFSINTVNLFFLPYDFLNFSSLLYYKHPIKAQYANYPFDLWVWPGPAASSSVYNTHQ